MPVPWPRPCRPPSSRWSRVRIPSTRTGCTRTACNRRPGGFAQTDEAARNTAWARPVLPPNTVPSVSPTWPVRMPSSASCPGPRPRTRSRRPTSLVVPGAWARPRWRASWPRRSIASTPPRPSPATPVPSVVRSRPGSLPTSSRSTPPPTARWTMRGVSRRTWATRRFPAATRSSSSTKPTCWPRRRSMPFWRLWKSRRHASPLFWPPPSRTSFRPPSSAVVSIFCSSGWPSASWRPICPMCWPRKASLSNPRPWASLPGAARAACATPCRFWPRCWPLAVRNWPRPMPGGSWDWPARKSFLASSRLSTPRTDQPWWKFCGRFWIGASTSAFSCGNWQASGAISFCCVRPATRGWPWWTCRPRKPASGASGPTASIRPISTPAGRWPWRGNAGCWPAWSQLFPWNSCS